MNESSQSKLVVVGLLLGIFMAAIDNTIVATAMGTIVSDLGSYEKFVWVTAGYMVAVMAGMPIYGKLSDMYGRKRFFFLGYSLFSLDLFSVEQLQVWNSSLPIEWFKELVAEL